MTANAKGQALGTGFPPQSVLLTVDEMFRADRAAKASGVSGVELMEAAGEAVAAAIGDRWTRRDVLVLCGPGNNGGDGFVVARLLKEDGWPVRLALLGKRDRLSGEAKANADRWDGAVERLDVLLLEGAGLVVDALFGAGLTRPLDGSAREMVEAVVASGVPCVAVDMPSGVDGDTGAVLGAAPRASVTVTFFRAKPGHYLYPGRDLCGELVIADIGIPEDVLTEVGPSQGVNEPDLWLPDFPWPRWDRHKYARGHALVAGGGETTGAARLAAHAARRAGAGVVTVLTPPEAAHIYRTTLTGELVAVVDDDAAFAGRVADPRVDAVLIGPGHGVVRMTRDRVLAVLAAGRPVVLDADALTVFAEHPSALFAEIRGECLMTPHEGEFGRLFPDIDGTGGKIERARRAAARAGSVVLLKGPDTIVAAPDGRAVVNANAPPDLATAGSGDVLAGFAVSLLAQGMAPFEAACCAAWLHGEAASIHGPGLVAEDISDHLPPVLRRLETLSAQH